MKRQSGQALVLVLLSLAVVLTLVLFVLSRSVTDIAVSSRQEESVRAFSAAEAGIEKALIIGSSAGSVTIGDASYTSSVSNFASGVTNFVYPVELDSGDDMTLWLKSHDTDPNFTGNTIKICWGKPGAYSDQSVMPAIETTLIYETTANDPATAKIFRAAFDPNTAGRRALNSFAAAGGSCTVAGQSFQFQTTLSLVGLTNPQFLGVKMLYNTDTSQSIAFDSTNASLFPSQGQEITSTGVSGESNRRLNVFQGWPEIPDIFGYAVYSSTGLTK
ncbi:MAG TPA: hypothetical protein VL401_01935 [Alphaproteobacteria bacterium]|jgi:Tfp pilus assembly protein PilX|nr:hypothetical protein [Alphaproteobacteria bacterium]